MKKPVSLIVAAFMLVACIVVTAFCAGNGMLTIKYASKATGRGVSGVELTVYQAAALNGGSYSLTADFAATGINMNGLVTTEQKNNVASVLYAHTQSAGITGASKTTNSVGAVYYDSLEDGIYLVAQTRARDNYVTIAPYIVYVPEFNAGVPDYNVLSNVKTEYSGGGPVVTTTDVEVAKIWDDGDDADGIRPASVEVTLFRGDEAYMKATLSSATAWRHTFSGLPSSGSYSVYEQTVSGYTAIYSGSAANGFTITNRHVPQSEPDPSGNAQITVRKTWNDGDGASRPGSVTVQLIENNTVLRTAQLYEGNGWSCVFENLSASGSYTVAEVPVPGYGASYARVGGNLYLITNTLSGDSDDPLTPVNPDAETVDIPVSKLWRGEGNETARPVSVTVRLIRNSSVYRSLELNEQNGWNGVFESVPLGDLYTLVEDAVENFSAEYGGDASTGFTVTNTYTKGTTDSGDPLKPSPPDDQQTSGDSTHTGDPTIPKTGTLNWPVPVLAAVGALFLLIGVVGVCRRKKQ